MRKFSLWIKILVVFSICAAIIGEVKAQGEETTPETDPPDAETDPPDAETDSSSIADSSEAPTASSTIGAEQAQNPAPTTKPTKEPPGNTKSTPAPGPAPGPESEPEGPAPEPEVSEQPPQTETTTKSISISTKPIVALTVGAVIGKMLAF